MSSLQELHSFQHYFLRWLGDFQVTTEVANGMKGETPFSRPATFAEDKDEFSSWGMMTLQASVAPFLFGFLEVENGNIEEASVTLEYIKDMLIYLADKDFMKDYLGGFHYLSRLLNHHFVLVSTLFSPEQPEPDHNFEQDVLVREYDNLEPKSKSILATAHWMMNESIRERKVEAIVNLKEMIQLDPTNWVWHYLMCSRTRFIRRSHGQNHNGASHPWPEEVEAAVNSVKYSSHTLHYQLMCTAAMSQCLAEIVRAKTDARDFGPIVAGEKKYASTAEVVYEIKNAACDALMEITCGFPEYIRYGEIFGLILPKQHRDYMVAAACMKTACVLAPNNSKVNHKMGSIILSWKKDTKRAIKYFRIAVLAEPHNFPAWMDLLPSMLSHFKDHEPKFERLFEIVKKLDGDWTPSQRGTFAFFEGCVEFLREKRDDAIRLWLDSISSEYDGFKELQRLKARCGWPQDHSLTYDAVLDATDAFLGTPEQAQGLLRLKQVITSAREEGLHFQVQLQRRNSERNGNGGGGDPREFHRQERQPRFRNSNSTSDADNDSSWRRGSGSQTSGESTLTQQFSNLNVGNSNQGRRGGRGGRDESYGLPRR